MWVFLNDAFLSIVQDMDDPDRLLVRARHEQDVENVFGAVEVAETEDADYRFRTFLPRATVAEAMKKQTEAIDYTNFKNSVPDHKRHDAYMGVWQVMRRFQKS